MLGYLPIYLPKLGYLHMYVVYIGYVKLPTYIG
jgi:hypothetical protein